MELCVILSVVIQPFAVVILAAGSSSRMGRPKQLLPYLGRTLIEHAARTALASGATEVIVVVGSNACEVRDRLSSLPVRVVVNKQWAEGMASSIRTGIQSISKEIATVVLALGDQPRITPDLLRRLAERQSEGIESIVASSYDGVLGAPAAFGQDRFPDLMSLTGESGAKDLIRRTPGEVGKIEFAGGNVDVDTPSDYQRIVPPVDEGAIEEGVATESDARGPPHAALNLP